MLMLTNLQQLKERQGCRHREKPVQQKRSDMPIVFSFLLLLLLSLRVIELFSEKIKFLISFRLFKGKAF